MGGVYYNKLKSVASCAIILTFLFSFIGVQPTEGSRAALTYGAAAANGSGSTASAPPLGNGLRAIGNGSGPSPGGRGHNCPPGKASLGVDASSLAPAPVQSPGGVVHSTCLMRA
ncbi:unnamed protein product [Cuscuta europaea]|uniref:Uncharacterized protein n=1 Tax=Cuscuta europaea TaxID=41803 RepID=A0A9P1DWK8_CUSEU|nr:unnamed protein product [Cuscuta europaea]